MFPAEGVMEKTRRRQAKTGLHPFLISYAVKEYGKQLIGVDSCFYCHVL